MTNEMTTQAPRLFPRSTAAMLAATMLVACAGLGTAPAKVSDGALTDAAGRTLYTFDRDAAGSGKSACNGPCMTLWPAFIAPAGASASGDYTVVIRDDGARQWAFKGKPLYRFSRDAGAGDRTGDGFNNVWHLARP